MAGGAPVPLPLPLPLPLRQRQRPRLPKVGHKQGHEHSVKHCRGIERVVQEVGEGGGGGSGSCCCTRAGQLRRLQLRRRLALQV